MRGNKGTNINYNEMDVTCKVCETLIISTKQDNTKKVQF